MIALVASCNEDDSESTTPPTPAIMGSIEGSVALYDEGMEEEPNDGLSVTAIFGTSEYTGTTNAEGDYTIEDVPAGTYRLEFEKAGYGTFKIFDVNHDPVDGSTFISETPSLGQLSTTEVDSLWAEVDSINQEITFFAEISPNPGPSNQRYVRFFFQREGAVNPVSADALTDIIMADSDPFEITFTRANFVSLGFDPGEEVRVQLYGESFFSNSYYEEVLDTWFFPNLNYVSNNSVRVQVQ